MNPSALALGVASLTLVLAAPTDRPDTRGWTDRFAPDPHELASTGRNPHFVLEPGYQLVLEGGDSRLTVTVLGETKVVDGVETRIVEELETKGDTTVEVSRNFFAISTRTNGVYYFGEDVDVYRHGKLAGHEGGWAAGVKGAQCGLMMPGLPLVGARYYQELAPGVAMDRAEIMGASDTLEVPAGKFVNVLTTEETTPLEPGEREYKKYAPGVGLLQDGDLMLVRYGKVNEK